MRCSGLLSRRFSFSSWGFRWRREFESFFLFWEKAWWTSLKRDLWSWIRGFLKTSISRIAESIFGDGLNADGGTVATKCGFPKFWTWIARTFSFLSAQILFASSFWTRRTIFSGRFSVWRKWEINGEVM